MKTGRILAVMTAILTLLSLLFIFSNSLSTAEQAGEKRGTVVTVIESVATGLSGKEVKLNKSQLTTVSKIAHVTEFALFAFFFSATLALRGKNLYHSFYQIHFCTLFCALTDEYLQSFSAGRGPSLTDCMVDLSGAIIGYGIAYLLFFIIARRKKRV